LWWHWSQLYAKASRRFDRAVELDPGFAYALCARASLLATCPDPAYRDGRPRSGTPPPRARGRARRASSPPTGHTACSWRRSRGPSRSGATSKPRPRSSAKPSGSASPGSAKSRLGRASPSFSGEGAFASTRVWCDPASAAGRRRGDRGAGGAGGQERGDLVLAEADLAEHLRAVLAQARRQAADRARGLAVAGRQPGQAHPTLGRVVHRLPEPHRLEMRVVQQRLERVHAHRRNVEPVEVGQPLRVRPRDGDRSHLAVEDLDVAQPRPERLEARIVEQVLAAGEDEEVPPVLIG